MKYPNLGSASSARRLWLAALGVVALALGARLEAQERNSGPVGGNNTLPPPPAAAGDETIGTLPALNESLPITRAWNDPHAAFYVEGRFEDVWSALVGVRGGTNVTFQLVDPRAQRVRLVFHGRVQLLLDRQAVRSASIEIGMAVPQTLGPASTAVGLLGSRAAATAALPGFTVLPIQALDASGALQSTPLRASIESKSGLRTIVHVASGRETVSLTQMH
ncbi:MAG: hypothetical protein ACKVWV_07445 [Planctomycetota bacterium]